MEILFEEDILTEGILPQEIINKMNKAGNLALEREKECRLFLLDTDRCQVSLTVVGLEEIHQLNLQFRNVDRSTDVLSFPQFENIEEEAPEAGEIILGDVVICKEKAESQAREFGHSLERELVYLFTHSILHLLGYDHIKAEDKVRMREREEEIMKLLEIER